jgi:hypothetical protein
VLLLSELARNFRRRDPVIVSRGVVSFFVWRRCSFLWATTQNVD